MTRLPEADSFKLVTDLAFRSYAFHAEQRLKHMNFLIIIAGFCIAGFFTAEGAGNHAAAAVISIVLFAMCVCFKLLDWRTHQLIKLNEEYLIEALRELADQLKSPNANFLIRAEDKATKRWSHRRTMNIIYGSFALLGILGVVLSLFLEFKK
jgi:hypothetical protein